MEQKLKCALGDPCRNSAPYSGLCCRECDLLRTCDRQKFCINHPKRCGFSVLYNFGVDKNGNTFVRPVTKKRG